MLTSAINAKYEKTAHVTKLITSIATTDFEEYSAVQQGWDIRIRPLRIEKFAAREVSCQIGGVQVELDHVSSWVEVAGTRDEGTSVTMPLNAYSSYASQGIEVTADWIDVHGPEVEVHAAMKPETSILTYSIYKEAVDDLSDSPLTAILAEQQYGHDVIRLDRQTGDEMRFWGDKFLTLCRVDDMPRQMRSRLVDESLFVLSNALGAGREKDVVGSICRYRLARRVRDYMLDRQSNPPTIFEVCNALKMSERKLHYVFKEAYGVTPKRFLKARRLSAARSTLKQATPKDRVSDIAWSLGFWDFSHFAKDYKTMFGEAPSATLRRSV